MNNDFITPDNKEAWFKKHYVQGPPLASDNNLNNKIAYDRSNAGPGFAIMDQQIQKFIKPYADQTGKLLDKVGREVSNAFHTERSRPKQTQPPIYWEHKPEGLKSFEHYLDNSGRDYNIPFNELDFSKMDIKGPDDKPKQVNAALRDIQRKPNQRRSLDILGEYNIQGWPDQYNYGHVKYQFKGEALTNKEGIPRVDGFLYPNPHEPYDNYDFNMNPNVTTKRGVKLNTLTWIGHHLPGTDFRTHFRGKQPYRRQY